MKDFSKILKSTQEETLAILAKYEQQGGLKKYIEKLAPDYIESGQVLIWGLCEDLAKHYTANKR